jgi:hypothetical protein
MRTAAGRRALQLALLVGGLFVLGFLCGEQAHAADGVTSATSATSAASARVTPSAPADGVRELTKGTVGRLVNPPAKPGVDDAAPPARHTARHVSRSTEPAREPNAPKPSAPKDAQPSSGATSSTSTTSAAGAKPSAGPTLTDALTHPVADQVVRPVTEQVIQSVDVRVVRPVGDLVRTVTDELGDAQGTTPSLPGSPSLPILPGLPELPGLPGLPGQTLPAPVTTTPPGSADTSPTAGHADGSGAAAKGMYGPRLDADAARAGAHAPAQGRALAGHAPAHQAPSDDPTDALSGKSAVDNGTSRHGGDAHAVTLNHRAPYGLVLGAAGRVGADGTRDRHRDIPVSPA